MLASFFYLLFGGTVGVLATAHVEQISYRVLRLVTFIAFALVAGVAVWHYYDRNTAGSPPVPWMLAMDATMTVTALATRLMIRRRGPARRAFKPLCIACSLQGVVAACVATIAGPLGGASAAVGTASLIALNQLLGAFLLGSITVAWLLGHAYLTATNMTIAPLQHFTRMLSWAVVLRVVFFVASIVGAAVIGSHGVGSPMSAWARTWLIVTLRLGAGLVVVGIFAFLVSDCVRRRATQSATGILYFGSILAYVGELANQQLIRECGWPL